MKHKNVFFCIDPGTEKSGICLLVDGTILWGKNTENSLLMARIEVVRMIYPDITVIIEDIGPYSVKLGQDVINTCKFIGELSYRLKSADITSVMILRWNIKQWVFETWPKEVVPEIEQRIKTNDMRNKNGELRQPHFVFVNDRGVLNAMKKRWGIEKPKPGKRSPLGMNGHAWQALALGTYYMDYELERNS